MKEEQEWLDAELLAARQQLGNSLTTFKARAPYALRDCVKRKPFLTVGAAAAIGFLAVGLGASASGGGSKKTPWGRIAFRGARLLGSLLPGLVGATAVTNATGNHNGAE